MAQFYTLEEAARVLGLSPDDLKNKAQQREIRGFLDSGSWRFRVVDVDELARQRGLGSDAELRLSDLDVPGSGSGESEVGELDLSEFQIGVARSELGAETIDFGQYADSSGPGSHGTAGSEHDIMLDESALPPNPMASSSSVIIGMKPTGKQPSDSDVRLVPDNVKGSSDSDVRIATPRPKPPSDSDVTLIKDDTADHGLFGSSTSGETQLGPSPFAGSSEELPARSGTDSDFELNPSSVIDALQPDSGSDFELSALDESDEYESIPRSKPSDSDVTAGKPNLSGINLSRPSDSGINLQSASGFGVSELSDSIELAPLSGDEIKSPPPSKPAPAKPKSLMSDTQMSVSPLKRGGGEKDIFDDTDFEVDAPLTDDSSEDQTVQLEAASDFELEESDTGSEVFAVDEEEVDQNAATAMGPSSFAEEDDDEDDGFDEAVSTEMASAWSAETSAPSSVSAGPAMVLQRDVTPEWGGLWVGLLGFTTFLLLFMTFLSWDLMRNLYDFQENSPASGIVSSISGLLFSK